MENKLDSLKSSGDDEEWNDYSSNNNAAGITIPPPPKPLSGPGASRQTRRLQVRNTGFRAATVPTRKVTPKSISSVSTAWSSTQAGSSDAENASPARFAGFGVQEDRRKSSDILSEIRNPSATLTRSAKQKPRIKMDDGVFNPAMANYAGVYADSPLSPPIPKTGIRAKTAKVRAKVKRRSVSAEYRQYIEQLEYDYEKLQQRLSDLNSPTVTRQRSSHLRSLSTEAKSLREENKDWESKFEARVQVELDQYRNVEAGLRSQNRALEEHAEEAGYRIEELEAQLENALQVVDAVEAANVDLEKRIEMMAEMLAQSPQKLELGTPGFSDMSGMRRKHLRPKSLLPRFPTVSSLVRSPEHTQTQTAQPSSPLLGRAHSTPGPLSAPFQPRLSLDTDFRHSDISSDTASVFSEAPMTADSMTSEETSGAAFNPWTMNAVHSARIRPPRRMRRFGGGSLGPKALILPATSHYEPVSAPHFARRGTMPSLDLLCSPPSGFDTEAESPISNASRRRASTEADHTTLANLIASPLLATDPSRISSYCPNSGESQATTRRFSSIGSIVGRNLMDELSAVRTSGTSDSFDEEDEEAEKYVHGHQDEEEWGGSLADEAILAAYLNDRDTSPSHFTPSSSEAGGSTILRSFHYESALLPTRSRRGSSGSSSTASPQHTSAWARLQILFSELWRSPVIVACHLIHAAQTRMRLPDPLRNVQWWLVGVLLGPMARRRMYQTPGTERQLLGERSHEDGEAPAEENHLAYGSISSPSVSSSSSARGIMSGESKKRSLAKDSKKNGGRSKHSPWLWLKFSITLAFAVGVAFKEGPGSMLKSSSGTPRAPRAQRKNSSDGKKTASMKAAKGQRAADRS